MHGLPTGRVWRGAGVGLALAAMALGLGMVHNHGDAAHHHAFHEVVVSGCADLDGLPHLHRAALEVRHACLACTAGVSQAPPPAPPQSAVLPAVRSEAVDPDGAPPVSCVHGAARPRAPPSLL